MCLLHARGACSSATDLDMVKIPAPKSRSIAARETVHRSAEDHIPDLADRIVALRKERGEKQTDLAVAVDKSRGYIANIETCRNEIGLVTLLRIAKHYDVSLDYLVGRTDLKRIPERHEVAEDRDELALVQFWRSIERTKRHRVATLLRNAVLLVGD